MNILYKKVKWSRYSPGVAQRVGRGIALLFHDRGTRRGWMVSSTPRPHFTPGKDAVPIYECIIYSYICYIIFYLVYHFKWKTKTKIGLELGLGATFGARKEKMIRTGRKI